jgi:hypothetical protein
MDWIHSLSFGIWFREHHWIKHGMGYGLDIRAQFWYIVFWGNIWIGRGMGYGWDICAEFSYIAFGATLD